MCCSRYYGGWAATSSAACSGARTFLRQRDPREPFRRCTRRGCRSATTATIQCAKHVHGGEGQGEGDRCMKSLHFCFAERAKVLPASCRQCFAPIVLPARCRQ